MVNIIGTEVPALNNIHLSINWILIALILVIFFIAVVVIVIIYDKKIYNRKIILFENIAGQGYQPTKRDKARVVKVGDGGEEILYLKKNKVYRTAYGKKMGANTYYFASGQDGYWYNFVLGDLDAKMGMLDIEPIDRDMRYMHVAIRKNIQDRYRKQNFIERYGTIMLSGIFILIMVVGLGILVNKMGKIADTINMGIQTANSMINTIISYCHPATTGGTGLIPA